ncbi:MAG TPA: energy-coupling factor ABC transporter permease [Rhodocyclaceae bacterium]
MNFPAGLFPLSWQLAAFALLGAVVLWAALTAPWRRLADADQSNVWLGSVVVLMLMWSMKAGVAPGLNMHLLGATALTLMFGRQLAILALCLVLAAVSFNDGADWLSFGLNMLVMGLLPVFASQVILQLVERFLPAHMFVYIFAAAFFGAGLCVVAAGFLATSLLWAAGAYTAEKLFTEYFPYYALMSFAEAWMNGGAITLMVVYYPTWVESFDDRRYLKGH